jgi:hypothetical protein
MQSPFRTLNFSLASRKIGFNCCEKRHQSAKKLAKTISEPAERRINAGKLIRHTENAVDIRTVKCRHFARGLLHAQEELEKHGGVLMQLHSGRSQREGRIENGAKCAIEEAKKSLEEEN